MKKIKQPEKISAGIFNGWFAARRRARHCAELYRDWMQNGDRNDPSGSYTSSQYFQEGCNGER